MMPMPMPPMKDSGKETRPPNSEAPTALTIMKAKVPTLTTVKGATSTPARPDTAPASAQLNRATLTGRTPISSAVGASWPAPRRPRPNQVRRRITARAVTRISEMTKMAARCRSTTTSRMLNPPTGNSRCLSGMARAWGPLSWSITPEARPRTAAVPMNWRVALACISGRMTNRSVRRATTVEMPTATMAATKGEKTGALVQKPTPPPLGQTNPAYE